MELKSKPVSLILIATGLIWLMLAGIVRAQDSGDEAVERDPLTGMIIAENWELTRANCIICHSPQQFLRQRGTRSTWQSVVDWMQKDHGLIWLVDPKLEDKIVTYLAENYPPIEGAYRRAPIPATLLPPNPYTSQLRREYEEKKAKGLIPEKPEIP
tara:strand:+ start:5133 stop:5600 length:468 start_codon:yes stop_codon:yes gene_type:complete